MSDEKSGFDGDRTGGTGGNRTPSPIVVKSRNRGLFPIIVFIALMSCSCSASETAVSSNDESLLIREIMSIRSNNRSADIDVSEIAGKYIKQGISIETAESLLNSYGFEVSRLPYRGVVYVHGVSRRKKNMLGFGDDIVINCEIRNGVVFDVIGSLSFRAL